MKVIEHAPEYEFGGRLEAGCVLSIGNFDGVHRGHQKILRRGKELAARKETELAVMTFEPHPVAILKPEKAPKVLTRLCQKQRVLRSVGVDSLVVLRDSRALLELNAVEFVEEFLAAVIRPSVIVEGEDFNFGAGRTGNVHTLEALGREKGFTVEIVETEKAELSIGASVEVSSTLIRQLLESGKVADARAALGRRYRLVGPVVEGIGKGRQLGFPTANMGTTGQVIPAEGVYAGLVQTGADEEAVGGDGEQRPAVFSIGYGRTVRPGGRNLLVEAHMLDERPEGLVGQWMAMDFVERIRGQRDFSSEAELCAQIGRDCETARRILSEQGKKD
jgi:riboflavin kinase/FMN adenylyltransferase